MNVKEKVNFTHLDVFLKQNDDDNNDNNDNNRKDNKDCDEKFLNFFFEVKKEKEFIDLHHLGTTKLPHELMCQIFKFEPAFRERNGVFVPRLRNYDPKFLQKLSWLRLKPRLTEFYVCHDEGNLVLWSTYTVFLSIHELPGPLCENSVLSLDKLPIYNDYYEIKHIRRETTSIHGVPVSLSMSFVFTRVRSLDPDVMYPRKVSTLQASTYQNLTNNTTNNTTNDATNDTTNNTTNETSTLISQATEINDFNRFIRRRIKYSIVLSRNFPIMSWIRS